MKTDAGSKKVALITGADMGIGFEVARQIGRAGWTVLAAARNQERGRQAAAKLQAEGLDVRLILIDLNAHQTAVNAAKTIDDQFGKLDLLINNAAISIAGDGPPSAVNMESLETVMRTNFSGNVAVTQAMLPLLQRAGKAQIIHVSSELGCISQQTDPAWKYATVKVLAYCASKAALQSCPNYVLNARCLLAEGRTAGPSNTLPFGRHDNSVQTEAPAPENLLRPK